MLYEKCAEVSGEFWQELGELPPGDVTRRTGCGFSGQTVISLPFLNRRLIIDPWEQWVGGEKGPGARSRTSACASPRAPGPDPGGQRALWGRPRAPLELTGGTTFFTVWGPHALPRAPLESASGCPRRVPPGGQPFRGKTSSGRRRRPASPSISRVGSGDHPLAGGCGVPGAGVLQGAWPS